MPGRPDTSRITEQDPFWGAPSLLDRGLQSQIRAVLLGYARWENFITAVGRAVESCKTTGYNPQDHFRDATKMIKTGKQND